MNAVIIEDEDIIAQVLVSKLGKVAPDLTILSVLPSLKTAKQWLASNPEPDLLFMDIQLSDGVSFDLFQDFQLRCPVIFTTAYDEYAIRAFRVNGIDYLLKPVKETELAAAVEKARRLQEQRGLLPNDLANLLRSFSAPAGLPKFKEKFLVNRRNQWMPVNTSDIACFCKDILNYIFLFNGEKHLVDFDTLDEVEELLDPRQFFRANRQYILNVEAVHSVKPVENSKLLVRLKEPNQHLEIDISRLKSAEFRKWMDR